MIPIQDTQAKNRWTFELKALGKLGLQAIIEPKTGMIKARYFNLKFSFLKLRYKLQPQAKEKIFIMT